MPMDVILIINFNEKFSDANDCFQSDPRLTTSNNQLFHSEIA